MKSLRIRPQVFKHLDSNTELTINLISGIKEVQLNPEHSYKLKIKNNTGYLTEYDLEIKGNQLVLTTDKLKDFTPDDYEVEVWDSYEDKDSIYPDEDYGTFKIDKNVSEVDGKTIPVITIEEFEKRIDEALKKVESIEQIKGDKGDTGERGPQGLQGPVGPQGPKGERGEVGPKGEKGDTGLQGEKGDKGDKGDTGERGADGKDGRDGVNGKDGINGTNGRDGVDGKSAYQIWLDLGNSGSEQDFINSLKAQSERHAPTGYMLDTSTKPWTLLFDNGCRVFNSRYWNNNEIFRPDPSNQRGRGDYPVYSIPDTIMNVLKGLILYSEFKNSNWDGGFFGGTTVENPINNVDKYNWDGTKIKKDGTSSNNRAIFAQTIYELGIWSDEIVEELGAVRKGS